MSRIGKQIRWSRFVDSHSKRSIIVPIDHGLTLGPIDGLDNVRRISSWIGHPAIYGVIAHKGMVERLGQAGLLAGKGVMVHLNGMSVLAKNSDKKVMLTSLEAAVRLGADAVSLQVNFLPDNHAHNIMLLGSVVDAAQDYGLPVLAMVYDKTPSASSAERIQRIRHLIRLSYELGIDAIKTETPEDLAEVPVLLSGLSEDVAIFFSGGELSEETRMRALAQTLVCHGGTGLCIGRNVFQRTDAGNMLTELKHIVCDLASVL